MAGTLTTHPEAPRRLVRLYRKLGTTRAVAEELGVNRRYVWELLANGRAPMNREIGRKLFVEYSDPARLRLGDRRQRHVRWWCGKTAQERNRLIRLLYDNLRGEVR